MKSLLVLTVKNITELESGSSRKYIFNQDGGTIGAGANNHWVLQDLKKNIPDTQANIEFRDNVYCLQVMSKPILINGASFTPKSGFIHLKNSDQIKFGHLKVSVLIDDEKIIKENHNLDSLEDIVVGNQDYLQDILNQKNCGNLDLEKKIETVDSSITRDPLNALQDSSNNIITSDIENEYGELSNSFRNKQKTNFHHLEGSKMEQSFIDLPILDNNESEALSPFTENTYVTISPLIREMDAKIELVDTQDTHDFLQEVGKTLKAAIEGLLALQKEQNSLSDKHLRPIEDNPLRLNLDYAETIDVLFGDQKSPVHLAAPSAVSESLHNLLIHNEANRIAIISALGAILDAFSPEILLRRFENYRRSNETQNSGNAWAWEMYKNYYEELISKRQYGFEKLFWEVYSQAYDKALRDKQTKGNK